MCGGSQNNETQTSCLEFTSGSWKLSHNLIYPRCHKIFFQWPWRNKSFIKSICDIRYGHTSWTTPDGGVLLVGGYYSNTTTEVLSLLSDQGDATELFSLEYPSRWWFLFIFIIEEFLFQLFLSNWWRWHISSGWRISTRESSVSLQHWWMAGKLGWSQYWQI